MMIHKKNQTSKDKANCWKYTQTKELPSVIKILQLHNDMIICREKNIRFVENFKMVSNFAQDKTKP